MGGEGGGTTVPGMHDLSQPLHSLCFSVVESGATEGVCGMQGRGWQGRGQGSGRSVSGARASHDETSIQKVLCSI